MLEGGCPTYLWQFGALYEAPRYLCVNISDRLSQAKPDQGLCLFKREVHNRAARIFTSALGKSDEHCSFHANGGRGLPRPPSLVPSCY